MAETVGSHRFALARFCPGYVGESGFWIRWSNRDGIFWRTESNAWDFAPALDTKITPNLFIPGNGYTYKCTHTGYIQDVEDLVAVLKLLGLNQNAYKYGGYD